MSKRAEKIFEQIIFASRWVQVLLKRYCMRSIMAHKIYRIIVYLEIQQFVDQFLQHICPSFTS